MMRLTRHRHAVAEAVVAEQLERSATLADQRLARTVGVLQRDLGARDLAVQALLDAAGRVGVSAGRRSRRVRRGCGLRSDTPSPCDSKRQSKPCTETRARSERPSTLSRCSRPRWRSTIGARSTASTAGRPSISPTPLREDSRRARRRSPPPGPRHSGRCAGGPSCGSGCRSQPCTSMRWPSTASDAVEARQRTRDRGSWRLGTRRRTSGPAAATAATGSPRRSAGPRRCGGRWIRPAAHRVQPAAHLRDSAARWPAPSGSKRH